MDAVFATEDVLATYETLKAQGVEFDGPPEKQPWGAYVMMRDSEGNRFCLSESKG